MGGEPYFYIVPYQNDVGAALQALRKREFEAGRYNPVMPFPSRHFPLGPRSPAPGRKHPSIEAALEASDADGTRSILDIESVSDTPDFGRAVPLSDTTLIDLYGTARPARAQVEADMDFFEDIERGHAVYIVLYDGAAPSEILFAGYSYD
jgi:hypothetical protein